MARQVAALFVRADSIYKTLFDVDAWDEARDARRWPGGAPVVAHPPCRGWGRMRQFSGASEAERMLAIQAVRAVQANGGVLEHPAESTLWAHCGLPWPGRFPDRHGGWSLQVDQCRFGHRALKPTWCYVVGVHPDELPPMPDGEGVPTHCIRPTRGGVPHLPCLSHPEREKTPRPFAEWLVEIARRSAV